ncbi:VOC family protein [Microbacterium testaceum]|uniref:VOC family protein n=1 Tax=Microbacterium testaceum TaxID=2033 RepID=UPI001248E69E|nr:VOC family protein [Microbacterium testaceum]
MTAPLVLGVTHSGLTVADLDDAIALWCSELGFALERTFALDTQTTVATTGVSGATIRGAVVDLGGQKIELLQYDPPRPAPESISPAHIGMIHIALTVSNLERSIGLFAEHGWVPVGTPHQMVSGVREGTRIVYLNLQSRELQRREA